MVVASKHCFVVNSNQATKLSIFQYDSLIRIAKKLKKLVYLIHVAVTIGNGILQKQLELDRTGFDCTRHGNGTTGRRLACRRVIEKENSPWRSCH